MSNKGKKFSGRQKPTPVRPQKPRVLDEVKRRRVAELRERVKKRQQTISKNKPSSQLLKAAGGAVVGGSSMQQTQARSANLSEEQKLLLDRLEGSFNDLQDDITLVSVHDDMGRIEGILTKLATRLDELREQGYVFRNYLENKIDVLTTKWDDLVEKVADEVEKRAEDLDREANEAERYLRQAIGGKKTDLERAESFVDSLEHKVNAARTALKNTYQDVASTIYQTESQLNEINWAFEQANQAQFDFLEGEYLISACQAELLQDTNDKDGPDGILYLTDERLLFEQKEKVATKKFLFITTSSEMVQELEFEALLGWITEIKAEDKRKFLSTKEMLILQFSNEAHQQEATFRLLGGTTNEAWTQLINRARNGEIDRERIAEATAEKEEATAQVSAAPTSCGTCGAGLAATIARGQKEITCEYCGSVTRL